MAFPSNIFPSSVSINSTQPFLEFKSLSGKESRNFTEQQYFSLTATFSNLDITEAKALRAFLFNEGSTAFNLPLPNPIGNPSGTDYGNWTLSAEESSGTTIFTVHTVGQSDGTLASAGDFVRIGSKVYMLTTDFTISGNSGTMRIFPQLNATQALGTAVLYKDLTMNVKMTNPSMNEVLSTAQLSSFDLSLKESIT